MGLVVPALSQSYTWVSDLSTSGLAINQVLLIMPNVIEGCGDPRTAEPALLEYSSATFNDLRGPGEAFRSLKELKGDDAIPTCIREVFDHHNMSEKFGVTLLHRHFDIDESERLVAVNDTSTPWGCEAYNNHALGKVLPQAFIFASPDKIVPFEYTFFTRNLLDNVTLFESATKAFLTELGLCLFSLQLDKVLGLRVHPGSQKKLKLEFTVNRANINIDMDKEDPDHIPTSWYFSGPKTKPCTNHCMSYCEKTSSGHIPSHV